MLSNISFLMQCSRAGTGNVGWSVCASREGGLEQSVFPAVLGQALLLIHPGQKSLSLSSLLLWMLLLLPGGLMR